MASPASSNWRLPPDDGWADDTDAADDRQTPQNPVPQMPAGRVVSPAPPPVQPVQSVQPVQAAQPVQPVQAAQAAQASAANIGMTPAMRDEVRMIARLAIDDALAPYARAQREIEARLDRLTTRASDARASDARASDAVITHMPMGAPPPVTITTSAAMRAPAPVDAPAPAPLRAPPPVPVPASAVVREVPFALSPSFAPPEMSAPSSSAPASNVWPPADAALAPRTFVSDAGDIDIPPGLDGSHRRKVLGWTVAVLLVLGLVAMIAATALSHSR